jgi:hypothetical protein
MVACAAPVSQKILVCRVSAFIHCRRDQDPGLKEKTIPDKSYS